MKKTIVFLIVQSLMCGAFALDHNSNVLGDLLQLEGNDYIKRRDKIVASEMVFKAQSTGSTGVLSRIITKRRTHPRFFERIEKTLHKTRTMRQNMHDKALHQQFGLRRNLLTHKLGSLRRKNNNIVNTAMVELLWKTSKDDYERLSAVQVLSLNSSPIEGVFEIACKTVKNIQTKVLAKSLLELMVQYSEVYEKGKESDVVSAVSFLSEKFKESLDFQMYCIRLLDAMSGQPAEDLREHIRMRIENINDNSSKEKKLSSPHIVREMDV